MIDVTSNRLGTVPDFPSVHPLCVRSTYDDIVLSKTRNNGLTDMVCNSVSELNTQVSRHPAEESYLVQLTCIVKVNERSLEVFASLDSETKC